MVNHFSNCCELGNNVIITYKNETQQHFHGNSANTVVVSGNFGNGGVTAATTVTHEGTVTAVTQDSKTYSYI